MADNIVPSIERLPVELCYRIFDNLDVETIIFSVRPVSKLFESIVYNYDRYDLNFTLMSKLHMNVLSRLINPSNVLSLTLLNNERTSNQIETFISFFSSEQFTRIRSLTLFNIDTSQLNIILEKVNLNLLKTFSIKIKNDNDASTGTSIIPQSTICKLENDMDMFRILKNSLLSNDTIQYLHINDEIDMNDLYEVFECCPHLYTLIIETIEIIKNNNSLSRRFPQLTSLTIKQLDRINIDMLELFQLMTSSLKHLKLNGGEKMMNGYRWEQFITMHLPELNKFECYFTEWDHRTKTQEDLELIISSFRTLF